MRNKKKNQVVAYKDLTEKVAIVWTRVSSYQQEKENCSLETQKEDCEKFAKENGIRIKYYRGGRYESAKTEGTGVKEMIALAKKDPEVNIILVRTSSRFGRAGEETMVAKSRLRQVGIYVIPALESFDPDDKSSRLLDNMRTLLDNYDNETRREATYGGTIASLNRGEWCLHAPFGYKRLYKEGTHHVFEITPMGHILKNAWIWRAQGMREVDIVDKLNAMGLRVGKDERPMCLKYISRILKNPFYKGWIEYPLVDNAEHKIKGNHPALIDEETFDLANGFSRGGYERVVLSKDFPMSNFLRCSDCGYAMSGYTASRHNKNGKDRTYHYYKCSTKGCKHNFPAPEIHERFAKLLGEYQVKESLIPLFKAIIRDSLKALTKDSLAELKILKSQRTQLEEKLNQAALRFATGDINKTVYDLAETKINADLNVIDEKMNEAEELSSNVLSKGEKVMLIACNIGTLWKDSDVGTQKRIQELIFPDGISYNTENGYSRTPRTNEVFVLILLIISKLGDVEKQESELDSLQFASWSRRGDSNTRPLRPERSALPTALLLAHFCSLRLFAGANFLESGCKSTAFF